MCNPWSYSFQHQYWHYNSFRAIINKTVKSSSNYVTSPATFWPVHGKSLDDKLFRIKEIAEEKSGVCNKYFLGVFKRNYNHLQRNFHLKSWIWSLLWMTIRPYRKCLWRQFNASVLVKWAQRPNIGNKYIYLKFKVHLTL